MLSFELHLKRGPGYGRSRQLEISNRCLRYDQPLAQGKKVRFRATPETIEVKKSKSTWKFQAAFEDRNVGQIAFEGKAIQQHLRFCV